MKQKLFNITIIFSLALLAALPTLASAEDLSAPETVVNEPAENVSLNINSFNYNQASTAQTNPGPVLSANLTTQQSREIACTESIAPGRLVNWAQEGSVKASVWLINFASQLSKQTGSGKKSYKGVFITKQEEAIINQNVNKVRSTLIDSASRSLNGNRQNTFAKQYSTYQSAFGTCLNEATNREFNRLWGENEQNRGINWVNTQQQINAQQDIYWNNINARIPAAQASFNTQIAQARTQLTSTLATIETDRNNALNVVQEKLTRAENNHVLALAAARRARDVSKTIAGNFPAGSRAAQAITLRANRRYAVQTRQAKRKIASFRVRNSKERTDTQTAFQQRKDEAKTASENAIKQLESNRDTAVNALITELNNIKNTLTSSYASERNNAVTAKDNELNNVNPGLARAAANTLYGENGNGGGSLPNPFNYTVGGQTLTPNVLVQKLNEVDATARKLVERSKEKTCKNKKITTGKGKNKKTRTETRCTPDYGKLVGFPSVTLASVASVATTVPGSIDTVVAPVKWTLTPPVWNLAQDCKSIGGTWKQRVIKIKSKKGKKYSIPQNYCVANKPGKPQKPKPGNK